MPKWAKICLILLVVLTSLNLLYTYCIHTLYVGDELLRVKLHNVITQKQL